MVIGNKLKALNERIKYAEEEAAKRPEDRDVHFILQCECGMNRTIGAWNILGMRCSKCGAGFSKHKVIDEKMTDAHEDTEQHCYKMLQEYEELNRRKEEIHREIYGDKEYDHWDNEESYWGDGERRWEDEDDY